MAGRTVARWLLVGLLAIVAAVAGAVGWLVASERGTAWLLAQVPGVRFERVSGTLVGAVSAGRIHAELPGAPPGRVVVDGAVLGGIGFARAGGGRWLRVDVGELRADRVEVVPAGSAETGPPQPPASLALPIELRLHALAIGALHTPALGDAPLTGLAARLHVGADGGSAHVADGLAASWREFRATGRLRIASTAPFDVDATVAVAAPAWRADAELKGPLAALGARVRLVGDAASGRPAPTVDANAQLRPFAAWPLGALAATTRSLDLSAIDPALPATAIDATARVASTALDRPAEIELGVANAGAGRWDQRRLPLRSLQLAVRARPDDPTTLEIATLEATLGSGARAAGRITGRGAWTPDRWKLDATLDAVEPAQLDARVPALRIGGPVRLAGQGFASPGLADAHLDAAATLDGQFEGPGGAHRAQVALDAGADRHRVELRRLEVESGGARARAAGQVALATPGGRWQARGTLALERFDPAPWWPAGTAPALRRGPHRLDADARFDLALPDAALRQPLPRLLAALRGQADAKITASQLAGVPLAGRAKLAADGRGPVDLDVALDVHGNRIAAAGRLDAATAAATGVRFDVAAPALARLAPIVRAFAPEAPAPAGALQLDGTLDGRWPELRSAGRIEASGVRFGEFALARASGRWQIAPTLDAPLQAQLALTQAAWGERGIEAATLELEGTLADHRLRLAAESKLLPPQWAEDLAAISTGAATDAKVGRSRVRLEADGGFGADGGVMLALWRGRIGALEFGSGTSRDWLKTGDVKLAARWAGAPAQVSVEPGRAELLGNRIVWQRIAWRAGPGQPSLDAEAELEPIAVAPILRRVQRDFGWGGDLTVGARVLVRSAPTLAADIVVERRQGDLTVSDESGTIALGLSDLRLGLNVADGIWSFTQGLAGSTLGIAAGAFVARTTPEAMWPAPDTPVSGVLELRVANLGTWGPWVPPGWRIGGALRVSAGIDGRFGAPEFTGEIRGSGITVRNFVEGVAIGDGEVVVDLRGTEATIERIAARAGDGTLRLVGSASLGEAPQADLRLAAERFQVLGRVDRRIIASGDARLRLDRDALALDGRLRVDEGLVDFTRGDAPRLGDDVVVIRRVRKPVPAQPAGPRGGPRLPPPRVEIRVDLGRDLHIRGRGLDAGLRGELLITTPPNRPLAINGTVSTFGGTYKAYGQKLEIDKGALVFVGNADNPRLDIEAVRPDLDVRVGVAVAGTVAAPRVRLFSQPEMSEMDKLSWLLLGRPSDGLGGTDTALLQRAALSALAGEGEGFTDQFIGGLGLDELSVRQSEDGDERGTVVALGKQLSKRWYIGYERSLDATVGTWQLIYRVARRFTLRAQSGLDNSLDAIWTWRWQ